MGVREPSYSTAGRKLPHWVAVTCAAVMFCHGSKTSLRPCEVLSFWLNSDVAAAQGILRDAFRGGYINGNILGGQLTVSESGRRAVYVNFGHKYANGLMMIDFMIHTTPRARGV